VRELHRRPRVLDREPAAGEDVAIDVGVEVGEAVGELELAAVRDQRA